MHTHERGQKHVYKSHKCENKNYRVMTHSYPGQPQHQSSSGDRGPVPGVVGRFGKLGKSGVSHGKG